MHRDVTRSKNFRLHQPCVPNQLANKQITFFVQNDEMLHERILGGVLVGLAVFRGRAMQLFFLFIFRHGRIQQPELFFRFEI